MSAWVKASLLRTQFKRVIGVDPDPEMLREAQQHIRLISQYQTASNQALRSAAQ
ncbi:MAG: hypothetical protein JO235_09995 [Chroococcidiopsidaceae cyanobacterium CP_BM_RX_35]|nr:hypothetical protein [Chroococcidiopsidaceae cyanobacterium CP_BM_RX_35]